MRQLAAKGLLNGLADQRLYLSLQNFLGHGGIIAWKIMYGKVELVFKSVHLFQINSNDITRLIRVGIFYLHVCRSDIQVCWQWQRKN